VFIRVHPWLIIFFSIEPRYPSVANKELPPPSNGLTAVPLTYTIAPPGGNWYGPDPEPEEPTVPLSHYLWILKRHRYKILPFIAACVLGADAWNVAQNLGERVRAKLFDPFFTTKFVGRGLGMSAPDGMIAAIARPWTGQPTPDI